LAIDFIGTFSAFGSNYAPSYNLGIDRGVIEISARAAKGLGGVPRVLVTVRPDSQPLSPLPRRLAGVLR